MKTWLEESGGDPGYQVSTPEEIADQILVWDKEDEDSDEEEVPQKTPKISELREWIDSLINYVDISDDKEVQPCYAHLRTMTEIIIMSNIKVGHKQC